MRLLVLLCLSSLAFSASFVEHTIATDLAGGYQVVVADLNHDGKPDLIALASGLTELVWFENPTWERHVIATGLSGMINCAAYDYDGDGIPEIALATGFNNRPAQSVGIVSILHHQGDPRRPWSVQEIDRLTTSHRLRWADIDGSGRKVLVNAPLAGANADAPDFRDHVPLVFYRPGKWQRETITTANEGVQHGIFVSRWNAARDSILTASFLGLHRHEWVSGRWQRSELAKGDPAPWPKSGTSDVAVGQWGRERFLAAIEPWHGNQVAVYREREGAWARQVIDTELADGHTILTADLDGNGRDAIVAGYRGPGRRVLLYRSPDGQAWQRQVLDDGGMAAAGCAAADLNGDGRIDVVCIGAATKNLKWYENQARP